MYILYKIHDNVDCIIMQNIVRYLNFTYNIRYLPSIIIERNIPENINVPTIIINDNIIEGIHNIAIFFENKFNINNLIQHASEFAEKYPDYRIKDMSTHRLK